MIAVRLQRINGRLRFVYFTRSEHTDDGVLPLPVEVHRRAWRPSIFRPPGTERSRYVLTLMQQTARGHIDLRGRS